MGVQIAKAMGLRVIAIDGGEEKKEVCLNKLGCEAFVDFTQVKDAAEEVVRITDGKGAHGIFVTAGTAAAYKSAPQMVRVGGKVMCIGLRKFPQNNLWFAWNANDLVEYSAKWDCHRWCRSSLVYFQEPSCHRNDGRLNA